MLNILQSASPTVQPHASAQCTCMHWWLPYQCRPQAGMYEVRTDIVGHMSNVLGKQSARAIHWVFASLVVEACHQLASAASTPAAAAAAAARRTKTLYCLRKLIVLHRAVVPASFVKIVAYCHCFAIAARTAANSATAQQTVLEAANSSNTLRKRPLGCSL